ncbi:MAG: hypothetical protein OSB83_00030 [Planctomycetota bacterium]|nr:hypothetical protein [Planctomycetota bacterium]
MKLKLLACLALTCSLSISLNPAAAADLTAGMKLAKLELKSAGPVAFGPDGILFVADPLGATVHAIATGDTGKSAKRKAVSLEAVDRKIAAALGTAPDKIRISDLAVNPLSGVAYLSVARGSGVAAPAAIVTVRGDQLEALDLSSLRSASFALSSVPDAKASTGRGRRRESSRTQAVTDLGYVNGRVLVAGMSNEEFSSSLRSIPFPFAGSGKPASVEIYHGAHGRFETRSPVRTFVSLNVAGQPYLVAAYQCTPLVTIPLSDIKPGAQLKGKTVAELGNRNRPLDMIVYTKGGKEYMLIANSSRGIMKVSTADLEKSPGITERVSGGGSKGVPYETIKGWKGILQLDKADDTTALVMRETEGGSFNLETLPLP